jgi:hypothetical protein
VPATAKAITDANKISDRLFIVATPLACRQRTHSHVART